MAHLVGIAGSLRKGSFNASLLRAAQEVLPSGSDLEIASIAGIPLYNFDVETEGIPETVLALKERIVAAEGLLLVTPEYNHSIPGVFKNAIDWLTRPSKDIPRIFGGRPVAIIGASAGIGGTRMSQVGWLPVLRTLGTRPWFGRQLYVANAGQVFDAEGRLIDDTVRKSLTQFMTGFVEFVAHAG
ncbi:MAG TPA: NADPH-dependent FMN reductase [Dongiaceae bacterium]|jgi:NAD(P)H-dependent FMN reductase|nr:NADPH-dependent FMN reductase [Dongiaceae bacterium]